MGTPSLSCSTGTFSNAPIADSDDEGPQSSMWVQQEGHTSSELPSDFLEPLSPGSEVISPLPPFPARSNGTKQQDSTHASRQFWKSGDFTGSCEGVTFATEGMDHVRVHPKFLHSNATSHKWVLGAIAELLDNAVDEIRNGATYVKVDVVPNPRNQEPMLVIEDDGGGMDPDCMRRCMSLGYSAKTKLSNTIGQYGNGFKTSTMRLGADVMVLTRSRAGKSSESVGMLSYTFLTATGQNDVIVPIVDFKIEAFGIRKLIRSNVEDWVESMEAIESWSPYSSQAELVNQFKTMPHHQGTRVVIYNLWEDDEGLPELDLTTDPTDIQIRSTTRDERNLKMAARYPSCRHYLTYRHSLRIYTSILYLRLPSRFRIFLRGKQVLHHNLKNEMMLVEEVTYKPKDAGNSKAVVTLGFVKDAKEHLDISGFNVYHKNRLIRPFWRIWNPSDTRGRGIIAILEANFVEPAHDKQGFERTIVLSRLEARLAEMQKTYFSKHCHEIGYTNAISRKQMRLDIADKNRKAAKGGTPETAWRNAQHMSRVDSAVTNVQIPANRNRDVSHVQVTGMQPESLVVSSASMMIPMQEASTVPARLEMQKHLSSIDLPSPTISVGKHNSGFLGRQGSARAPQEGEKLLHQLQHVALKSDGMDSQLFDLPSSSEVHHCQSSSLGLLHPPSSIGVVPAIIDLDSPDNDLECDVTAFELPCLDNCDGPKPLLEKSPAEMVNMMRGATAGESVIVSRETSDDKPGCLEGSEARGFNDTFSSFSAVPIVEKVETSPGRLGLKASSELAETVSSLDKVAIMSPVEARAESFGMESCALMSETVPIPTSKQAPLMMSISGFQDMPRMQTNEDTCELGTESFLQVETVIENASCQDITMIEASDPLKSSSFSAEGLVSAVFDLNNCDGLKPMFEKSPPEMIKVMRGANAGESIILSREKSDDIAVCREDSEAKGVNDASNNLLAVPSGSLGLEGSGELVKTVSSLNKVAYTSPLETGAESLGLESSAPLSETLPIPTSKQASSTMFIPGLEALPKMQTNEETDELGIEPFLQVKTVIENASCQDITMIDAADVKASDTLKSSTSSAEGHVSAVFDFDNCDGWKPMFEKSPTEMVNVIRSASGGESMIVSREKSDDTAGCLEGGEARGVNDASSSFSAVSVLEKMETLPVRLGLKGSSQLAETVSSLDKVAIMSPVEARAESFGMESCDLVSLSETVPIPQASPVMSIPGFQNMPRMQTNEEDTGELGTESFLQVRTVTENAPCKDIAMIDATDVKPSDSLKPSTFSAEVHVSAVFDLDDLFDSPIQQDDAQPPSPQSVKAGDTSVASPVVDMDITLPDILENSTLDKDILPSYSLSEVLNGIDNVVGIERDSNVAQENATDDACLSLYKELVKGSATVESSSKMDIRQDAKVLTEMDAGDLKEEADACLVVARQKSVANDLQHVSGPIRDGSLGMPVNTAEDGSGLEQEGRDVLVGHCVTHDMTTSSSKQTSKEDSKEDINRVLQGPTSIQASNEALQQGTTSFPASSQALQEVLAFVPETAPAVMSTRDISISPYGDMSSEEDTARVLQGSTNVEASNQASQQGTTSFQASSQALQEVLAVVPETAPAVMSTRDMSISPYGDMSSEEDAARVSQGPTSVQASNQALQQGTTSFQASSQALQGVFAVVPETAPAAVSTGSISLSPYDDLSSEDGLSRLFFAKQAIEALQENIEVVAAEADDIREQLQQQRHLQELDMRNLNLELEKALLRLNELQRCP